MLLRKETVCTTLRKEDAFYFPMDRKNITETFHKTTQPVYLVTTFVLKGTKSEFMHI
jgi:hypothetical protein